MKLNQFLCNAEATRSKAEFFEFLALQQSLDENSIRFSIQTVLGEKVAVITGAHAHWRMSERVILSYRELTRLIDQHLRNAEVAREILSHRICLDDEDNIVGFDDDITTSIVATEDSNVLVVYEAGLAYIRVKTLWDTRNGTFLNGSAAVMKLMKDGTVLKGRHLVPEVI